MIVSRSHGFVFVQVPQTGCTAVGQWIVDHLGGVRVLRKHTTLPQARRLMGSELDGLLVVASVRDSLDQFVSSFHKAVNNAGDVPGSSRLRATPEARRRWAASGEPTVDGYIDRFVRRPHAPVYALSLREADVILRFEHLQADVAAFAARVGADHLPQVPLLNQTAGRQESDLQTLTTPERFARLEAYHRPYRHEFGYTTDRPRMTYRIRYEAAIRAKEFERRRDDRTLRGKMAPG